jgi:hypothetical protein
MSDPPLGRYHFLSWARRGIGASVANPDNGSLPDRASLDVQLALQVDSAASPVQPTPMQVQMYGPGDILGIDLRHIVRTDPRDPTVSYEPNYLCGIEFDAPDFPWLFTPAAPNGDRLRPWLALIALKPDEFELAKTAPIPLPVVNVTSIKALQDLSESWNWAHVQVSGDTTLADAMKSAPGNVISRLLCPRRLDPEVAYTAFLVPAFEIGRQAGLDQDVTGIHSSDPAWTAQTAGPLSLPFYYQFQFHTSDAGDFESLVRRLTPRVLPAAVGQRPMDVSQPAKDIPSAGSPLGLEGALHSVSTQPTPWSDPAKTAFQSAVQTFISHPQVPIDDPANPSPDDPVIAPPIYGRWHAAVQAVDRTAPGWVNDLNLDPRNRSAGGMGTQVVQKERTQLMASAWQQVDGIRKANQLLMQAQLARTALIQLYRQHFQPALAETVMTLTAPLHARVLASPTTILATVRASRVPERMLSATFRRTTRPRRRLGVSPAARPSLLARVNSGDITIVPPPKAPDGLVSIEQVSDQLAPPWAKSLAATWPWILVVLLLILLLVIILLAAAGAWAIAGAMLAIAAVVVAALWSTIGSALQNAAASGGLRMSGFTPQAVAQTPARPNFAVAAAGTTPGTAGTATGADSAQAAAFRAATADLFTQFQGIPADPPPQPALDLVALKTTLLARLDPAVTVPRRALSLMSLSPWLPWKPLDLIEPIMAAPEFPQPMYVPLRDLSPQYVLPGVDLVPPDTLGLLLTNHAFIEAYMVGLNHEMARQLLWNDYPTDQRGSYFRQFWDVKAYVRQPGDPTDPAKLQELIKDIPPIHTWPRPVPLGRHPNRTDIVQNNVVLLVRGELFKRYPHAIVYAGKAKKNGMIGGTKIRRVLDDSDERYPIFRGELPNDMTFLGFNLSLDDARGGTAASPEGFFFVFQEQPSEPRFGLEPTERSNPTKLWADLAWTNFSKSGGSGGGGGGPIYTLPNLGNTTRGQMVRNSPWRLASQVFSLVLGAVPLPAFLSPNVQPSRIAITDDSENPDDTNNAWGVNSAQTAYVMLRLPFRVLIHADLMLPPS